MTAKYAAYHTRRDILTTFKVGIEHGFNKDIVPYWEATLYYEQEREAYRLGCIVGDMLAQTYEKKWSVSPKTTPKPPEGEKEVKDAHGP